MTTKNQQYFRDFEKNFEFQNKKTRDHSKATTAKTDLVFWHGNTDGIAALQSNFRLASTQNRRKKKSDMLVWWTTEAEANVNRILKY